MLPLYFWLYCVLGSSNFPNSSYLPLTVLFRTTTVREKIHGDHDQDSLDSPSCFGSGVHAVIFCWGLLHVRLWTAQPLAALPQSPEVSSGGKLSGAETPLEGGAQSESSALWLHYWAAGFNGLQQQAPDVMLSRTVEK